MKREIITTILCGCLAIGLAAGCATGRKTASDYITKDTNTRYLSKGGVGFINTNLDVVVKSAKSDSNELIFRPTNETVQRWKGRRLKEAEMVVFYEGKVWPVESLPGEFDLSKAIFVSFEAKKIRFYDFQTMSGGYYARLVVNER